MTACTGVTAMINCSVLKETTGYPEMPVTMCLMEEPAVIVCMAVKAMMYLPLALITTI